MEDTYRTIKVKSEGIYREKGSRFLSFGYPVENETEIKQIITTLKKEYHDARHHCYAYRIGIHPCTYRVNDDGEPSGTAGKPIYGQILSHDLFNILIVVVRYFGGTLLGTSGLMNAYRSAADDMITNAMIVEQIIENTYLVEFPYESAHSVMKLVKEEKISVSEFINGSPCSLVLRIRKSQAERVIQRLMMHGTVRCSVLQSG